MAAPVHPALDSADLQILNALQRDGRLSHPKLAREVHLSPKAVVVRVRRLMQQGFILGYTAQLSRRREGVTVLVEVKLDRTAPESVRAFETAVQSCAEIVECCMVAGSFDYLVRVCLLHVHDVQRAIAAIVWSLPGVRETRTHLVSAALKRTEPFAG